MLFEGEYVSRHAADEIEFSYITHETDRLSAGCLFVCLCGTNTDTHYLAAKIAAARPAAVIVEREREFAPYPDIPLFRVDSSRLALTRLWSRFCGEPQRSLRMIGITGTNGKTSTAHILSSILRQAGHKVATIGTVGCELDGVPLEDDEESSGAYRTKTMTTPDPDVLYRYLRRCVDLGAEFAVMEVSSHSLSLSKVDAITFELGIFTNLSPEHLDFHHTMEDYLLAKAKLFSMCNIGIFNADDKATEELISRSDCKAVTCGVLWSGDFRAKEIKLLGDRGCEYRLALGDVEEKISLPLPGATSVYNSLIAISAAITLGISPGLARDAAAGLSPAEGRLEVVSHKMDTEFSVIIDYAHTEAALASLLHTARSLLRGGRLILLFGCGGDRDRTKRAPMGATAEALADLVIVTSDNPRTEEPMRIILDIIRGMPDKSKRRVILDRREAIGYAVSIAKNNDLIVLAGKGHEKYELANNKRKHFDEREIVRAAVNDKYSKQL